MNFTEFKSKFQKIPVEEYENVVPKNVKVSVCVQAYQHEKYIEQCLDSIINQQTTFDYEILLGEDASSDKTREICIAYAKKYPQKIRLFLHHRENNIYINDSPSGRFNLFYNFYSAKGKFIAICEGDDYWTDPLKLQKQLTFMESNPTVVFSFHACNSLLPDGKTIPYSTNNFFKKTGLINKTDLLKKGGGTYATPSLMIDSEILQDSDLTPIQKYVNGDIYLVLLAIKNGEIGFINDNMAIYRVNSIGSWSNSLNLEKNISKNKNSFKAFEIFNTITNNNFKNAIESYIYPILNYNKHTFYIQKNKKISKSIFKDFKSIGVINSIKLIKLLFSQKIT